MRTPSKDIMFDDIVCDPYISPGRIYNRLLREYKKYGRLIIAFDFDDTVFDTHNNDWEYPGVIRLLQRWRPYAYLICWSASEESRYPMMLDHFERMGIPCDAINENAPWIENRGRKIYANAYLDDRSGIYPVWKALNTLITEIEEGYV